MQARVKILLLTSLLGWASMVIMVVSCSDEEKKENTNKQSSENQLKAEYIGAKACGGCHQDIYKSYLETGKGKAFHAIANTTFVEDFRNAKVFDKHNKLWYRMDTLKGELLVTEYRVKGVDTTHLLVYKADYVIGSGNKTRTYLYEENNFVYEIPVTWYVEKKLWDLSPGYEGGNNSRFDRPITLLCMSCHNSDFQHVGQTVNKFTSLGDGIGCEKCHGPGSVHQMKMKEDPGQQTDPGIINPSKLPIALQFDVCRQCHLEGINIDHPGKNLANFRPGQPLDFYTTILIPTNNSTEDYGFASHAERLQQSKCFIASNEKLTCVSCHDPHKKLDQTPLTAYNQKCLNCHESTKACSHHKVHQNPNLSCVTCHMPKNGTTDIPHVSTSDHFIRIPEKSTESKPAVNGTSVPQMRNFTGKSTPIETLAKAYLSHFEHQSRSALLLDTVKRMLNKLDLITKVRYFYLSKELPDQPFLQELKKEKINDARILYQIADIHYRNALDPFPWFEKAYALDPDDLNFVSLYAEALQKKNRFGEARNLLQTLLEKKPGHREALSNLGFDYLIHGDLEKAEYYTRKALRYHPDHILAKENIVNIYLQKGLYDKALKQLNELQQDYPQDQRYQKLKLELKKLQSQAATSG